MIILGGNFGIIINTFDMSFLFFIHFNDFWAKNGRGTPNIFRLTADSYCGLFICIRCQNSSCHLAPKDLVTPLLLRHGGTPPDDKRKCATVLKTFILEFFHNESISVRSISQ